MTMFIRKNDVERTIISLSHVVSYIDDIVKITGMRIKAILYVVVFQAALAPFKSADILGADLPNKSRMQRLPACIRSSQSQRFVC